MALSEKAKEAMEKVVTRFQAGDLSPLVEMSRINLPENAPAASWSFGNRVLAYAQTGSLDCRGYRQWQAAGRQVAKGEHSAWILGPMLITKTREQDGESEKYQALIGFKGISVFAYHQTEGEPGAFDYTPKELPPLVDVAEALDITIRYEPLSGANGSIDSNGTKMTIGAGEWRTFFHELGHAVHARLNGQLKGGQHADQETVAELTAAVLGAMYGKDYTGNSWQYISAYNDDPVKALMAALDDVGKIVELIESLGGSHEESV